MQFFLSNFTNKVDAKGRVSIPSDFRAVIASDPASRVYVGRSFTDRALDGYTHERITELAATIGTLRAYNKEKVSFARSILGEARAFGVDAEGRIVLPEAMRDFAGIKDQATFVGIGPSFQIWEPDAFHASQSECMAIAADNRDLLDGAPPAGSEA